MPVSAANQTSLLELRAARRESDRVFSSIQPHAIYDRPIDARHRIIFYVGHLDGFDSIQICREGLGIRSFDPALDNLFQAGIDPDSAHLPTDQPSDWPSVAEVNSYVRRSREHVDKYLENAPEELVNMALEHRLMHLETLAYMFHNLEFASKSGPAPAVGREGDKISAAWCEIPAGIAVLGKAHDEEFGWDNEFEQHSLAVPAFRIQRYSVTNGEYLAYVRASGARLPHFWTERGDGLYLRCMFGEVALPLNWPVYVSYMEAEAYARSQHMRVATEAEFQRAATGISLSAQDNVDFRSWDPKPVDSSPESRSAYGVEQLVGNGWEWTSTPFGPFPGFRARASYPGYSSNFFDGEHFVLKGGSSRTATRLLRPSFRNWYRRDYPHMYAKFRCVEG